MKAFVCVCTKLSQNNKMIADRQFRDNKSSISLPPQKMFSNALFVLELLKINTFMLTKQRNEEKKRPLPALCCSNKMQR